MPAPARNPLSIATIAKAICTAPDRCYASHADGRRTHNERTFTAAIGGFQGLAAAPDDKLNIGDVLMLKPDGIAVVVERSHDTPKLAVLADAKAPALCWLTDHWSSRIEHHLRAAPVRRAEQRAAQAGERAA